TGEIEEVGQPSPGSCSSTSRENAQGHPPQEQNRLAPPPVQSCGLHTDVAQEHAATMGAHGFGMQLSKIPSPIIWCRQISGGVHVIMPHGIGGQAMVSIDQPVTSHVASVMVPSVAHASSVHCSPGHEQGEPVAGAARGHSKHEDAPPPDDVVIVVV